MSPYIQPRFPYEPLERLVVSRIDLPHGRAHGTADGWTDANVADYLGVDRVQIRRWRRAGLPERSADRVAVAIGEHPALIWTDWYEASIPPDRCGSQAGYSAHMRAGTEPCRPCRDAMTAARRRSKVRRRAAA